MGKYCRSHIGKTFNDGKLTVVDGGDRYMCVKVRCTICAEDSELFGDGVFEASVSSLNNGIIPCGCSKSAKYSLEQYAIKINRKIVDEELPIEFIGFGEKKSALSRTAITLFCKRTSTNYIIHSINGFFAGNGNSGTKHSISEVVANYNLQNTNSEVWDTGKRLQRTAVLGFHCKICEGSGFEYVFEVAHNNLMKGTKPCYCSNKHNISGDHIVEVSKRKLHEQGVENVSVISAFKKNSVWHVLFMCEIHGAFSRGYGMLDKTSCCCLKCSPRKNGYDRAKQGYLYILDIQTPAVTVLGYGITNDIDTRISSHRTSVFRAGATITNIQVFEGSGTAVLAVENAIKSLHTTGLLDCEGFRRESISIDRKEEVLELCKKLKELDNPNKLI